MIAPKQSADFVYYMEQVLAVYERPYNERFAVVCLDESPKQLIEITQYRSADGTRMEDSEYVRRGVGEIYRAFDPLAGQRFVYTRSPMTNSIFGSEDQKAKTEVVELATEILRSMAA